MPVYLLIAYVCFHITTAELNNCNRDLLAGKASFIYYRAFQRKTLPTMDFILLDTLPP